MRHFTVSTYSGQAYSQLAQLSVWTGQCSDFCFLRAVVIKKAPGTQGTMDNTWLPPLLFFIL